MNSPLTDLTKVVGHGKEIIDDVNYSGEERNNHTSQRHVADMASDSWLSKNVRPMTLIYLMLAFSACLVAVICGVAIDPWITAEITAMLMAAFGWYFNSKKHERVAEKNAKANIEMVKEQSRHEREMEKERAKTERQRAKAAARLERIQARRGN